MTQTNRQWRLAARPVGMVKESDFALHEEPVPSPGGGQVPKTLLRLYSGANFGEQLLEI